MTRETLPQRRHSEVFDYLSHRGFKYTVTVGFYDDGRPGEVFLEAGKEGTDVQVLARDSAVLISLLLQYGCPISHMRSAISREMNGAPQGEIGHILDVIEALRP